MVSFTKIIDLAIWLDTEYATRNGVSASSYNSTINYNNLSQLKDTSIGIKQQFNNWDSLTGVKPAYATIIYTDYTINPAGVDVTVLYNNVGNLV